MDFEKIKNIFFTIYFIFILINTCFIGIFILEGRINNSTVEAANTIYVGSGQTYENIQDAIDNANIGDTIRILDGTFSGELRINKKLTLIGNGKGKTIINNGIIKIKSNGVIVKGFHFINCGCGIKIDNSDKCEISDNYFENNDWCFDIWKSSNITLIHNNIHNNNFAIEIEASTFIKIKYNNLSQNFFGLYIFSSANNTISNNDISAHNESSINLRWSNHNIIENNTISLAYQHAILVDWTSSFNRIINNIIIDNIITKSRGGIDLRGDSQFNYVANNNIENTYLGIGLWEAYNNTIKQNEVSKNKYGFYFRNASYNLISTNTCLESEESGLELLDDSIENLFYGNYWLRNKHGIYFNKSNKNHIKNDSIYSNKNYGIFFSKSSNNIIENCTINKNLKFDIYFDKKYYSLNNIAINSTIGTYDLSNWNTELIIKNYLHFQINVSINNPVQYLDINVKDNNETIFSKLKIDRNKPKSSLFGQIKWILVTDRIYRGSNVAMQNITEISISSPNKMIIDNNRNINMSNSHFEYFNLNNHPNKSVLKYPFNNSFINTSLPKLNWNPALDIDGDLLRYILHIKKLENDWHDLFLNVTTSFNTLGWNVTTQLPDGEYQWRVCANDGHLNGPWSTIWKFTIDTTPPELLSVMISNNTKELNTSYLILKLHAYDRLSGVAHMSFSENGENWTLWENYSETKRYLISTKSDQKTIYFKVKDYVGNIANPTTTKIILNTTFPEENEASNKKRFEYDYWWIIIILIIILVMIIYIFLLKQRKKRI